MKPLLRIMCVVVFGWSGADAVAALHVDSVADFSSTQGYKGWHYGYVDVANGPDFIPLPIYQPDNPGGPGWVIDPAPSSPPFSNQYFTSIWADRSHPNALTTSGNKPEEHWTVRRWISDIDGPVTIAGLFGDNVSDQPDQDGIIAEIRVDGSLIWTMETNGFLQEFPYSVSTSVEIGSLVDFIGKPKASDFTDHFTFTAQISTLDPGAEVPEFSSMFAWLVLMAIGAAWKCQRR